MTSSLVGSEMCIRDRVLACLLLSVAIWLQIPLSMFLVNVVEVELALDAVSYTHLTLPTICSV
eukprot:9880056-Prorocentrum_lima.AAC.1